MSEEDPRNEVSREDGTENDKPTGDAGGDGEQLTGGEAGAATVEIVHVRRVTKQLRYAAIGGMAIFEGDIALDTIARIRAKEANGEALPMGIGIRGSCYRWPGGIVPYQIHPDLLQPERVIDAIARWEEITALRFVQRTGSNAADYDDYVSFEARDGCWSYVGRRGGEQVVSVGVTCSMGNVMHEMGHAIGLWHEQSRADRDKYVKVEWNNISEDDKHNFEQHIVDGDDLGSYDFESIMHYPATAFSKNGHPTLVVIGGKAIGQRQRLSAGDQAAVRLLYPELYP